MFLFLTLISEIIIYNKGSFIYKLDTEKSTASIASHIEEEKIKELEIPSSVMTPK